MNQPNPAQRLITTQFSKTIWNPFRTAVRDYRLVEPDDHIAVCISGGKDSLLLATLAYNVGPYRILGSKKKYPKSTLLKKIEAGIRDFKDDYVKFCHWKGKKIPSIERRRYAELFLLYNK